MQKAKRQPHVEQAAQILAFALTGYTITITADNGRDRIEVTSGPISAEERTTRLFKSAITHEEKQAQRGKLKREQTDRIMKMMTPLGKPLGEITREDLFKPTERS